MTNANVLGHVTPGVARAPRSTIADLMGWPAVTISPWVPARFAERVAVGHEVTHLPVVERERLTGIVCLCDLWGRPEEARVLDCMTREPVTIDTGDPIAEAVARMVAHDVGCLPVMGRGRVVGVLTRGDLLRLGAVVAPVRCTSCGSHHHVREVYGRVDRAWCVDCLSSSLQPELREMYEDLGGSG